MDAEYLVPSHADVPDIDVVFIETTGVRVRDLPITLDKLIGKGIGAA